MNYYYISNDFLKSSTDTYHALHIYKVMNDYQVAKFLSCLSIQNGRRDVGDDLLKV